MLARLDAVSEPAMDGGRSWVLRDTGRGLIGLDRSGKGAYEDTGTGSKAGGAGCGVASCRGGVVEPSLDRADTRLHCTPCRTQALHGRCSSHLTRLCLHRRHPARDLVYPRRRRAMAWPTPVLIRETSTGRLTSSKAGTVEIGVGWGGVAGVVCAVTKVVIPTKAKVQWSVFRIRHIGDLLVTKSCWGRLRFVSSTRWQWL